MESDLADLLEPHSKVEFDGAMVLAADMEPGYKPVSAMISHELPDETRCKAFATMCRMGADAADLGVTVERQALAAHRDQFAIRSRVRSNAIVRTHFARPFAKKAGEREGCERDHLGRICVREVNNFGRRTGRRDFFGQHHLEAFQYSFKKEFRHVRITLPDEPYRFARAE